MASQIAVKARRGSLSLFRITFAFALSFVTLTILGVPSADARPVQASIVVDAATGEVLSASNADTSTYPASLTKMMTLYLLFEAMQDRRVKLTDTITFSKTAAGKAATNLNVRGGDRISVETAILALVVRSANDAATAIAEHLGGTEAGFARLMTNKAQMLGMSRTTFRNANGLPDAKQRTTARDMATLSVALIRDFPEYYGYFKRTSFKYRGVTFRGHNKLLKSFKGYDGIKTGYIRASGFNLASSAERDGRRLVVVVLGGTSPSMRDRKVADLLTSGFKSQRGTGTLIVERAIIANNTSEAGGGGLYTNGGIVTVSDSTLSGNHAHDGGGIDNNGAADSIGLRPRFTLANSTLISNTSEAGGGGMTSGGDSQLAITDSRF
ncbi:MAG: D-alanyl-D-alanine carboxypeptidase [Rhodospirillaceae bacterium]|nr:D-alanyl-D-alanine carboxypeptidase [Rhodospirillaceae bacterium]